MIGAGAAVIGAGAAVIGAACGTGTTSLPEAPPVVPIPTTTATAAPTSTLKAPVAGLAVGDHHACALDAAGHVRCWGVNDHGQLGDGTRNASATPVLVTALEAAIEVGASGDRTCALTAGGEVLCWGDDDGQDRLRPEAIEGLSGAAALTVDPYRICVALRSGEALCRGTDWLGDGVQRHATPVIAEVAGVRDAIAIRAGCVLSADGSVRCWGLNSDGDAGDGTTERRLAPVRVRGIEGATAIASGSQHACALLDAGTIACWGRVTAGDGSRAERRLAPMKIPGFQGARAIAAWGETTCAALGSGEVTCWGGPVRGTLAAGEASVTSSEEDARALSFTKVPVEGVTDAVAIAITDTFACARSASGSVSCWGENLHGELGNGSAGSDGGLVTVAEIDDATRVAAGDAHTCALRAGGSVWCWGNGRRGQIGDGTVQSRGAPVMVAGIDDAIDLAATTTYACAARRDGSVSCWGSGVPEVGYGGDSWAIQSSPAPVRGVRDVKRIAAETDRVCARLGSGRVACWGADSFGALGVPAGSTTASGGAATSGKAAARLAPVTGLAGADALAMGGFGACATTKGRALWCWGGGAITAWAPGGPDISPAKQADLVKPVAVLSVKDAVGVGLYGLLGCVVRKSGRVACWEHDSLPLAPETPLGPADEVDGLSDAVAIEGDLVVRANGQIGRIDSSSAPGVKWVFLSIAPQITDAVGGTLGRQHVCVVRRTGAVVCWGQDGAGQLGAGARGRAARAASVVGFP